MAVAHDATTESTYTTTSPHAFNHTPTGTPRGVGVRIVVNANEVPATAVSYGGVDMGAAQISATDSAGEAGRAYIWYIGENVLPGVQAVSITHAGSATTKHVEVFTVTANRSTYVVTTNSTSGDGANPTIALDSGSVSALRYGALFSGHDATGSLAVGASQSANNNHDFGSQTSLMSRQTNPSTGSFSLSWTATSEDVAFVGIAVAEVNTVLFDDVAVCVEAAFGYGPTDTPGWFDLTDRCRELTFSRGRSHELDAIQAGSASFVLDNQDGALDANNTASVYYPNVKPMVPIRVTADYSGTAYPLWYGFVEGWPVSFPGQVDAIVSVSAVDLFKLLSLADASGNGQEDAVMALDPDAYWRFSGSGLTDSSGNSHTLTLAGTPTTGAAGVWTDDEAVTFDGTDDAATVASETTLEYVDVDMTLATWVKPASSTNGFVASSSNSTGWSWGLWWFASEWVFTCGGGTGPFVPGDAGSWQHVVATVSGTTISVYVNGVLSGTDTTGTAGAAARTVYIGRDDFFDSFFHGDISEIALWGVALSQSEISSLYKAQAEAFTSQLTSDRIADILTAAGFTSQDLETGVSTMSATATTGSMLDLIADAVNTEAGLFFIAADGQARFQDRHWRTLDQITPIDTFSDNGSDLSYVEIVPSYDDTQLWNEIIVTANDAESSYTATDASSVAAYGRRTLTLNVYPADENEAADRASWTLGLYKDPATRIDTLVCKPRGDSNLWPVLFDAEISNRYTVDKSLAGDDLSQDVYLEAISFHFLPKDCTVTLQLSPASNQSFWLLGEAGFSELDETTVLGF